MSFRGSQQPIYQESPLQFVIQFQKTMKVIFCVLAALCAVHASEVDITDPTRILANLVARQKKAVEDVIDDLTRFQVRTFERVEINVNNIKSEAMLEIEKMIRTSLDEVRKTVTKAKHEGKDAEVCYEAANGQLDTIGHNGNAKLSTCLKNALAVVQAPLENVANSIETARQMITDLDAIIPDCYSSIFIRMQNCVIRKVFLMRSPVRKLESNARSVKRTATTSSFTALRDGRSCATKTISEVRTGTTEVRVKVGSCVRNI